MRRSLALTLLAICLMAVPTLAAEPQNRAKGEHTGGKWTPEQILAHDPAWLRAIGLELPPEELWKAEGGGLLEAVVQVNGCSSGFVSSDGLLITNHHCAFSLLQEHSTPERDLITDGFLAADRAGELAGETTRASIPHRFTDVTAEIEAAAAAAGDDDLERYRAIDRKEKELVAACEEQPFRRCQVAVYDDGVTYRLIEALEFPDVRLVYAPPRAVGEYGGEVDNWSWPRHTGDFALLRVYAAGGASPAPHAVENTPYRPRRFLPIARVGVGVGDFVMVIGYPGRTYRSWIAEEAAERLDLYFPERSRLYRAWMDVMEEAASGDDAVGILLADRIKGLANREKNSRGQVVGILRGNLIETKRQEEAEILAWAAGDPRYQGAATAHQGLVEIAREVRATWHRDFLLGEVSRGAVPLDLAVKLVRQARERAKPDLEREPEYQERNRERILASLRRAQKRIYPETEVRLLADYLGRLAALPAEQKVAAVDALFAGGESAETVAGKLLAGSQVGELAAREAMFAESVDELTARRDPLLDFALRLVEEIEAVELAEKRRSGAISRLRPTWRRAVAAHAGRPVDPDANGTLRVSLAHVEGYEPRDAVWYEPRTTLGGMLEKHTGEEPFNAPEAVREAAGRRRESHRFIPELGDVPICFLATGDTTGGSSGSPVVNGRGELVGVNFDRVWENVANDFGYNPAIARNVSVDVRYLLWLLEDVEGPAAARLLRELGAGE